VRPLRILYAIAVLIAIGLYFPVYYHAFQYAEFVETSSQNARSVRQLRRDLLDKAQLYFLPVKAENIEIRENGPAIKVDVNYQVPVDFYFFQHIVKFHAAGSGAGITYRVFGGS
jgi:hypothetical protein